MYFQKFVLIVTFFLISSLVLFVSGFLNLTPLLIAFCIFLLIRLLSYYLKNIGNQFILKSKYLLFLNKKNRDSQKYKIYYKSIYSVQIYQNLILKFQSKILVKFFFKNDKDNVLPMEIYRYNSFEIFIKTSDSNLYQDLMNKLSFGEKTDPSSIYTKRALSINLSKLFIVFTTLYSLLVFSSIYFYNLPYYLYLSLKISNSVSDNIGYIHFLINNNSIGIVLVIVSIGLLSNIISNIYFFPITNTNTFEIFENYYKNTSKFFFFNNMTTYIKKSGIKDLNFETTLLSNNRVCFVNTSNLKYNSFRKLSFPYNKLFPIVINKEAEDFLKNDYLTNYLGDKKNTNHPRIISKYNYHVEIYYILRLFWLLVPLLFIPFIIILKKNSCYIFFSSYLLIEKGIIFRSKSIVPYSMITEFEALQGNLGRNLNSGDIKIHFYNKENDPENLFLGSVSNFEEIKRFLSKKIPSS